MFFYCDMFYLGHQSTSKYKQILGYIDIIETCLEKRYRIQSPENMRPAPTW